MNIFQYLFFSGPEKLPSGYLLITSGYSMAAVKSEVFNMADPNQTCDPFPDFPIVNIVL